MKRIPIILSMALSLTAVATGIASSSDHGQMQESSALLHLILLPDFGYIAFL